MRGQLAGAEVVSRGLATAAVRDDVERNLLALVEGAQTSALNGADVNENVLVAVVRLDEAEALLVVEPLHGAHCHSLISFQRMHSGGHVSRLVDFGEIPETCSPIG